MKKLFQKYANLLPYLFFGVLTTAVNYAIFFPCHNLLGWSAGISNILAWVVAVAFAFVTNKTFVFHSYDWSSKTVLPELMKFIGCRIGSGVAETVILIVTVDWLLWNGNAMKLLTAVLVIVLNYLGSNLFVFRKKG